MTLLHFLAIGMAFVAALSARDYFRSSKVYRTLAHSLASESNRLGWQKVAEGVQVSGLLMISTFFFFIFAMLWWPFFAVGGATSALALINSKRARKAAPTTP